METSSQPASPSLQKRKKDSCIVSAFPSQSSPEYGPALAIVKNVRDLMNDSLNASFDDQAVYYQYHEQKGDLDRTVTMLKEAAFWKNDFHPEKIQINDIHETLINYGIWLNISETLGKPVIWVENFEFHSKTSNPIPVVQAFSFCLEEVKRKGFNDCALVIDFSRVYVNSVDDRLIRVILIILEMNYPCLISLVLVTGVSFLTKTVFNLIRRWIASRWMPILHLYSYHTELSKQLGVNSVPLRFGGKADNDKFCATTFLFEFSEPSALIDSKPTHTYTQRVDLWVGRPSLPPTKLPSQVLSGPMQKIGGIVQLWKSFHFVLQDCGEIGGALYYYKRVSDNEPNGVILLYNAVLIETNACKRTINLQTPMRLWRLYCDDAQWYSKWLAALDSFVDKVPNEKGQLEKNECACEEE